MPYCGLDVSQAMMDRIKKYSKAQDATETEFVREALYSYIAQMEGCYRTFDREEQGIADTWLPPYWKKRAES